jgi:macrolide transport system ATP-binding/permease protein
MREWIWRLWAMLRRDRMSAERNDELQLHYDLEVEAGLRRGLSPEEAQRRARWRLGSMTDGMEDTRAALGIRWLDGAAGDLRHAYRALTRNRGFAVMAILVLAASVAINTLIFFMLDGVVLRPLPYAAPERLVRLYDNDERFPLSVGHFLDYRANAKSLNGIALYTRNEIELSAPDGRSQQLEGLAITTDYFSVLGRALLLGHGFTDADLEQDNHTAILSYRLWRDHFQSDPAIVGKSIRLDRQAWTVIGVAPEGFQHVGGAYRSPMQGDSVDIWVPLSVHGEMSLRAYHFCNTIARLRDGYTAAQSKAELASLIQAYGKRYPRFGDWWTVRMEPLLSEVTGRSRDVIWLLVVAGGLVLLVACANIAGLCVARAVARRKELSLRHALGANRWQLARVGLAENLLIGVAGAILGLVLADAGLPLLHHLLPADFPRAHEIALTPRGAIFAAAIAMATVLLAGLLPSLGSPEPLQAQHRVTGGRDARRVRMALVVGEITLAGLLCAGALFLLRSYEEINARDHGFTSSGVLTFRLTVSSNFVAKPGDVGRLYENIRMKIAELPGVAAVGATSNLPWSGYDENLTFGIYGRDLADADLPTARQQVASPGYFEAAGMRLVSGRSFDRSRDVDGQPLVAVVNDALVRRVFPKGDAVGATLRMLGKPVQVVGVVTGIQDAPADDEVKPAFWFALAQEQPGSVFFAVRSAGGLDPATLTASVTSAVHAVDPELPLSDIRTLDTRAAAAMASRRFALWLFQAFAALALMLSAAGIYGLLAYVVRQRRKELGIRVALGANRADLWTMVLGDGVKMAAAGAIVCLGLIPLGGSLLRAFLYNVRAFDLITMAGAPAALLIVAILASLGPARSAMRSDPSLALRED